MSELILSSDPGAPDEDKRIIRDGLRQYNIAMTGNPDFRSITLFLRDAEGIPQGGLLGDMWGGRVYINTLWVSDRYRGQGYGSQLLEVAEAEARAAGCRGIDLGTFSFQGRPFYEKHGFEVFAQIDEFPPGHTFYYMRKALD